MDLLSLYTNGPYGTGTDVRPWQNTAPAMLARAQQQYPFIKGNNPAVVASDKSETWPVGEEGDPSYPRPSSLPVDRPGIEVPPTNTSADIAGEVLHVDPYANQIRSQIQSSLSPEQTSYLKRESLDYGQDGPTIPYDDPAHRLQNATDSAIRGQVAGQWPAKANAGMNYNPSQMSLLNMLQQYMQTGTRGF